MKLVFLLLFLSFFFKGCFSPPLEPIFDYKAETQKMKENQASRKKSSDPSELEQICNDNESGRARALEAFLKQKEVSDYWKRIADDRKSDAEFGRSIKHWIMFFLIGGAVALFAGIFLYFSGFCSKVIGNISKIFSLIPSKTNSSE